MKEKEKLENYIAINKKFGLVDSSVTCKKCGALHASYYKECPRCTTIENKEDQIVNSVINSYKFRSAVGINKYKTTLEDNELTLVEWLVHLQEELMDATLYIEKIKRVINAKKD